MVKDLKKTTILAIITVLITLVVISGASYAWFSFNRTVSTNSVAAKTSQADVELLLSKTGFTGFTGSEECDIVQVNTDSAEKLLPVSTDDLKTFCTRVGDAEASSYKAVTDETNYYHGRVYMQASSENSYSASKLALYLDNTDSMFVADTDSLVLNATRIGLVLTDESGTDVFRIIIRPTESQNASTERENNTYVNGSLAAEGVVISNATSAVTDPSKALEDYDISKNDSATALGEIEINQVYQLDIYFYLEGCDPDCVDSIATDGANLFLSFYGAMI